ncbi:hypothetical protein [Streptomyces sp. NPDC058045]|uniref:hypothetical protein n=1 Tax=Streptomyces sp. NPDC058045 TaxID=3346311 RepID=UPI0036E3500A
MEQISGLTRRYGQRTERLRSTLASLGLALAGRAGARLAAVLGVWETTWHHKQGRTPLWQQPHLTDEEAAHQDCRTDKPSTPLRSALLMRSMPLWYRFNINPAWIAGHATRPDRLTWHSPSDVHSQVIDLLTRAFPGPHPRSPLPAKDTRLRNAPTRQR